MKVVLWATTFHTTEKYILQENFRQNFISKQGFTPEHGEMKLA